MIDKGGYFNVSPRTPWVAGYIFSNIVGVLIMLTTGKLIGDSAGGVVENEMALLWAMALLVFTYFFMLIPVFNFIWKIKVKATRFCVPEDVLGKRIGLFLFILQVGYALFNYINGVNTAGSIAKTDSPFSVFFVLFPVDALFLIYYGVFRENRYFYPNLMVWVASNILRGWSGIFLFIIFFEWCRGVRNKKVTLLLTAFCVLGLLFVYPAIFNVKMAIRAAGEGGLDFNEIISIFAVTFTREDFFLLMGDGVFSLISRIQIASILVEVIRLKDTLQLEFLNANFSPFWLEGLHGVIIDRVTGGGLISISAKFPEYANFPGNYELGEWNTNISYVGWFFIAPILIPQYILYTFFLAFLSIFFVKKLSNDELAGDMVWIAWLVYLLAPWLSVFVTFIYALMLFYGLKMIFSVNLIEFPLKMISKINSDA